MGNALLLAASDPLAHLQPPTHVSHPTIAALCAAMRASGCTGLIHYAGASWRDAQAWQLCLAWIATPSASEDQLKDRALRALARTRQAIPVIVAPITVAKP